MDADRSKSSSHTQTQYSYNKKLLDNMSTLLEYVEKSRQDLLGATKSVLTAYKSEFEQSKSLEDDIGKLRADNAGLELARDKVEVDLLRLREAYNKEVVRNEDLTQNVKVLQAKLKQIACLVKRSDVNGQLKKSLLEVVSLEDTERKESIDSVISEQPAQAAIIEQADQNVQIPEQSSTSVHYSSLSRHSSGQLGSKRLKSSTLSYSVPNRVNSRSSSFQSANSGTAHEHNFTEMSKLRFQTCQLCKNSIMPMSKYFYCLNCDLKVDRNCHEQNISVACGTQKALALTDLISKDAEYAVPELVLKCCEQIEQRGLESPTLYQENNEKEANKLFVKYLATKNVAQLKLYKLDICVLTTLVVHTLSNLDGPLIGAKLWQDFARAGDQKCSDQRSQLLGQLINQMSKANRHTLAYLLLHLKQVTAKSFSNKLGKQAVASLFGAVIANDESRQEKSTKHNQIKRAHIQRQIVLALIELPTEYYKEALNDHREPTVSAPNRRTTNYQVVLMNDRQRKSFYEKLSSSMY